jgi:glutathione-regulated potassium-efflux system ancillary protein KefG
MNRILILFAHPRFEHSVINQALVKVTKDKPGITFHDLYELYPDFAINIKREQELLLAHDIIIWQHPFYWYSCPPLLKQWIDLVLEFNWAYGPRGDLLTGKYVFNTLTSGGTRDAYQTGGRNRFTLGQLLAPFNQTAYLCKMKFLPPFAVQGTHRLTADEIGKCSSDYARLLDFMIHTEEIPAELSNYEIMNDFVSTLNSK